MPIYEFKCATCGSRKEKITLKVQDVEAPICEKCNKKMEKAPSSFGFDLKGTDWYKPGKNF